MWPQKIFATTLTIIKFVWHRCTHFFKIMFFSGVILFLLTIGVALGYGYTLTKWFYHQIYLEVPTNVSINPYNLNLASYYFDAYNQEIYREFHDVNRTIISYDKIPQDLINAIVAIEDHEYFTHKGISPRAITRAIYHNYFLKEPVLQGGSTITQQLAKNLFLSGDQTYKRKLKEMVYAYRIEQKYNKEQILEFYLNTVPFGGTAYGIEAASQQYFHKTTADLTLAEATFLAGLPAAPTHYSPENNPELAKKRQLLVLFAMHDLGKLDWPQVREAYWYELNLFSPESNITYPHFVYFTQDYLKRVAGIDSISNGGLKIFTSIDPEIQNMAQNIVETEVKSLQDFNISNSATLITKNSTGEILAMVGSKGYYDQDIDGKVNLTTALRQPGSAIKPINYALYLQNNHTLSSILKDIKVTYKEPNGEVYQPENYDQKYRGDVTVRRALANSLNIPSIKALEENGVENFVNFAAMFGLDPWPPETWGLALSLGAGEVRMHKMNQAFATFPNGGNLVQVSPIRYVLDSHNNVVYYNPCLFNRESFGEVLFLNDPGKCQTPIISPEIAFLITSVLTDSKTRTEAFGVQNVLNVEGTGVKTGTTNSFRDNWTFGFNQDFTVGVWVGNNDNTPMSKVVSGVTGAAPIWNKLISLITNPENTIDLKKIKPDKVESVKVCAGRNSLPCRSCTTVEEYYIKGTAPSKYCLDPVPPKEKEEEKKEDKD